MTPRHAAVWLVIAAGLLGAVSAAWAADPASVMPADVDYYVAVDLDAVQQADQILPQLAQDYWAKSEEPGRMGLAALAAAAPVIHAQLAEARSLVGPTVGVGVYGFADLYGAYLSGVMEAATEEPSSEPSEKKRKRVRPLAFARKMLPHLDVVIAAEMSDPARARPLLERLEARQKRKKGKGLPPLAIHVADNWVVLATKPERLDAVKAVMAGQQPALASQPAYGEIVEALPGGGVTFCYADVARYGPALMEQVRKAYEEMGEAAEKAKASEKSEEGEPGEGDPAQSEQGKKRGMIDAMMRQYMALYTRILGEYYGAMRGAGSSFYLERAKVERRDVYLIDPDKIAQVPLLGKMSQPVPMTGAAVGVLPAGTLAVVAGGGVGEQVGALLAGAAELDPSLGMFIGMGKGMVGGFLGLDVDKDLLPTMEQDVALALLAVDVTEEMPAQVALVLQGRDEASVSAVAAKLDTLATERFKAKLERGTMGSTAFREIHLSQAPFTVCYAPVGDLLVVTTGKEALAACLEARQDPGLALAAAPEVERLMNTRGGTSVLGFVRAGDIIAQLVPVMPPQVKAMIGDGIGLDRIALASRGDAQRQELVMEMQGDVVALAEAVAQGVAFAMREGLLRAPRPKPEPPSPAPEPAPAEPEQ